MMSRLRSQYWIWLVPLCLVGSIALLVRAFPSYSRMYQIWRLVVVAAACWTLLIGMISLIASRRFGSARRHITEIALLALALLPLLIVIVTKINRTFASQTQEIAFTFVSERAYHSAPFGMLKTDKAKPTKFKLTLLDARNTRCVLSYTHGPLFPMTQPGELIVLPMEQGLFGTWELSER